MDEGQGRAKSVSLIPWMRKIYEVPPGHRDWYPQGTNSLGAGTEKLEAPRQYQAQRGLF